MISCKKATELISKSMEEPLSLKESLSLRVHLFICEFCEQFKNQVAVVRNCLRRNEDSVDNESADKEDIAGLSKEDREHIKQRIKDFSDQ